MVQNHSQLIEDKFKQCGMFNAIDGSENKKAKITGCSDVYDVDGKEEPGALEDYLKNNADKHSTTAGLGRATTYDLRSDEDCDEDSDDSNDNNDDDDDDDVESSDTDSEDTDTDTDE